jgi:DNA-binding CsgD family transcriptional regulator
MPKDDDTEGLLDAIYEAALDGSKWDIFLRQLARSMPGTRCTLVLHDPSTQTGQIPTTVGWDPSYVASYNQYYASVNPWLENVNRWPVGLVVPSELRCPVPHLLRSEFYADWLQPQNITSGAGVTIIQDAGRFMALATLFAERSDEQRALAIARMQRLVPHLQRAAQVNRQLANSEFRWQAAEQALNRLLVGVVLVNDDLSIVFSNSNADALIAKADGISLARSGRLTLTDPDAANRLAHLVRHPEAADARVLSVRRPSGERPFTLLVAPLLSEGRSENPARPGEFRQARAMLFIKDTGETANVPSEVISAMFDLSPAEARLVKILLEGHRLEEIAVRLGVSHNTVKTQLKSVFEKLGCARQGDVIRLVSSSLPHFIR